MPNLTSPTAKFKVTRILGERNFADLLGQTTVSLSLALGIPLLGLVALIFFLLHSAKMVDHTNAVILNAFEVDNQLITMQNGARGFRLAHDTSYLVPFYEVKPQVLPKIDELIGLTSDNPSQQARVRKVREVAMNWMQLVSNYIEHAKTTGENPSPEALLRSRDWMDDLQGRLKTFKGQEEDYRAQRSHSYKRLVTALYTALALAVGLGVPLLIKTVRGLLRRANRAYQEALFAAERRASELHVTLNSIGDGVVATNREGKVDFVNAVAERMTGWTNADAVGRPLEEVFNIFNEQTKQISPNPVERVITENHVVGLANHTVLRSKTGQELPIEDSAAPIRSETGEVLGVILVFHDVSEKKEAEKRRKEIQDRAHFLNELGEATRVLIDDERIMEVATRLLGEEVHASRCAYAEVDPDTLEFTIPHDYTDGCRSTVGTYDLRLFGPRATDDMLSGRTLVVNDVDTEFQPGEGREMFNAIGIKALICCPLVKEGQLRAMMAVHQTIPRHWTNQDVELVEEVVERCWATIERGRAESESNERAERFRLLSEVVSLQVWMADLQGNLSYVNQECVDYFGAESPEEILGASWTGFVHPDDMPQVAQQWEASVRTGERYQIEFRLLSSSNEYRWFIARAEIMRDAEDRPLQWFGSNTDIHDLKRAQGKAEEANRAKDAFLAALSHELRTPLTPVLMTASALRGDERLPADVLEQLDMMERNIALEARLIDDLLDVTSISQGKLQLRTQPCDAHALIKLAVEIVHQDADAKQIELECKFSATRSELDADPARFQQVIWNLLRNAVKYTPHHGKISIQTMDKENGHLGIEVTDSGIGIASELLEQIFTPFEQGGLTGDHRFGGMGLGLSIARAILQVHGGTIRATSTGPGLGATFLVDIPGARSVSEASQFTATPLIFSATDGAQDTPAFPEKRSLRLLLVEDHDSTLLVLTRMLTRDGHSVVPANSTAAALAAADCNTFDLVISDLGLPDGTGHDLMEKLRDRHGLRGIALSGYGMKDDLERSRNAGFILHLVKPIDFARLRQALATL